MRRYFLVFIFLTCCISQSVHDERFRDSSLLSGPTNSVTVGDPTKFTFAAVGDLHIAVRDTTRFRRILQAAQAAGDAFIVLLGDLVDKGNEQDFNALMDAINEEGFTGRAFPVLGNHDIFENGWAHYKTILGASHYTFEIGNSRFIVLDTGDGAVGEDQKEWFESELNKPRPTNTFVLSHYLPTLPGIEHYLKIADDVEALRLMRLAKQGGVRAWFGAHYHAYLNGVVENVRYICAGGAGGRRMANAQNVIDGYFYVQVSVDGANVSYLKKDVE